MEMETQRDPDETGAKSRATTAVVNRPQIDPASPEERVLQRIITAMLAGAGTRADARGLAAPAQNHYNGGSSNHGRVYNASGVGTALNG